MKINWQLLKRIFLSLDGKSEYKKYLHHCYQEHPDQTILTKQKFFAKKETEKWNKINRCC